MTTIINDILEMLKDDMVSHGLIAQCVKQSGIDPIDLPVQIKNVLEELLKSGKVEVGITRLARPDYVEFVAWKGSIAERASRAMDAAAAANDVDKEFAYWLSLRENVDRFEGEQPAMSKQGE